MPWHISDNRGGGAEIQAWYFAVELARLGHVVYYVCQSVTGKTGTEERDGVTIFRIRKLGKFQSTGLKRYYNVLTKIRPDLVVQRMSSAVSFPIAKYCRRYDRKFIWICSDDDATLRWMHVRKYQKYHRPGLSPKRWVFLINAFINDLYRHRGMHAVDIAFTQHNRQSETLFRNYDLSSARIISGHPPVRQITDSTQRFKARQLVWVANMAPRKQPEIFVGLAKIVESKGYRCVLVGSRADQDYLDEIFHYIPPNLELKGRLSPEEVNEVVRGSTFLVNTSAAGGEGFPNTFIQAWLRGLPVISFNIDPDRLLSEKKMGFVVSDPAEVPHLLQKISLKEYDEMSRKVREYAQRNHTVRIAVERFLADLKVLT